jgi:hypothetical protein
MLLRSKNQRQACKAAGGTTAFVALDVAMASHDQCVALLKDTGVIHTGIGAWR